MPREAKTAASSAATELGCERTFGDTPAWSVGCAFVDAACGRRQHRCQMTFLSQGELVWVQSTHRIYEPPRQAARAALCRSAPLGITRRCSRPARTRLRSSLLRINIHSHHAVFAARSADLGRLRKFSATFHPPQRIQPSWVIARQRLKTPLRVLSKEWHRRQCPLVGYVMCHPTWKDRGLAALVLARSLRLMKESGHSQVRAVITEGNVPSERLFLSAGFRRLASQCANRAACFASPLRRGSAQQLQVHRVRACEAVAERLGHVVARGRAHPFDAA